MRDRQRRLLSEARKLDCDTLVAFEPENLFYMTGFWGEAVGLLSKDGCVIVAPELEAKRARDESCDCKVVTAERGVGLVSGLINRVKKSRVCTDCQNYDIMSSLRKSISGIKASSVPFYNARMIKDDAEIRIIKKASQIIDSMFELCAKKITVGQSESELQAILMIYAAQHEMFDTGYRFTLNPLIVAGGPNGALPHAQVTGRKFKQGDLIVVDITLRYKGYVSDATRTFALGKISDYMSEAYNVVKESQRLGLKAVKPNVKCASVDDACRSYIDKCGFGKYFIHSTGHGIGLEVHELPAISRGIDTKLKKNMAITVEPGIYIENKFGIRIEDSVIVKDNCIVMHKFTKDLLHL